MSDWQDDEDMDPPVIHQLPRKAVAISVELLEQKETSRTVRESVQKIEVVDFYPEGAC